MKHPVEGKARAPLVVLDEVDAAVTEVEELHGVTFPKLRSVLAELRRSLEQDRREVIEACAKAVEAERLPKCPRLPRHSCHVDATVERGRMGS